MGTVFKAVDPSLDRVVAIKTVRWDLPPDSAQYSEFKKHFYREARILGSLSHSNITALFDMGETSDGQPYMAMEYQSGQSLRDHVSGSNRLETERALRLLGQIASGIDYAHSEGVVHRDLKPANILIDGDDVKITDFGIAKFLNASLATSGQAVGTPSYMAPEQATSDIQSELADIFSFGVIAFELLSGEHPFPGENVSTILYRVVHAEPIRPLGLRERGFDPERWDAVFSKALHKTPERRSATARELMMALAELRPAEAGRLAREPATMTVKIPALFQRTPWISRQARPIAMGAAALLAAALVTSFHPREPERSQPPPRVTPLVPSLVEASVEILGELSIQTEPMGATVSVDGAERGQTPIDLTELPLGNHALRIEKEGFELVELATALTVEHSRTALSIPLKETKEISDDNENEMIADASDDFEEPETREKENLGTAPAPIAASVELTDKQILIKNDNEFDWEDVKLEVDPLRRIIQTARIKAHGSYTIAIANLSTHGHSSVDWVRVSISCETADGRPIRSTVSTPTTSQAFLAN